jgi:hypothetical protein
VPVISGANTIVFKHGGPPATYVGVQAYVILL